MQPEGLGRQNGQFVTTAEAAAAGIEGMGGAARKASGGFAALNKALLKIYVAIKAIEGVSFLFVKTAEIETQAKSLEILTGSAEKAGQVIKEIQDFSAVTPFTSSELIDTTKRLKAFGVETENLVKTTKMLADVSGATGAKINEVALAYGQVQAKASCKQKNCISCRNEASASLMNSRGCMA